MIASQAAVPSHPLPEGLPGTRGASGGAGSEWLVAQDDEECDVPVVGSSSCESDCSLLPPRICTRLCTTHSFIIFLSNYTLKCPLTSHQVNQSELDARLLGYDV